jgi:hypothetical protein
MNHAPSSQDFRIGIEAAAETLQSNTAFAFLQRIQNHRQQQQLSENDLDDSAACVTELDSGAFLIVMTCALRTGDCDIVQLTLFFDGTDNREWWEVACGWQTCSGPGK